MLQILQSLRDGRTEVAEVPAPACRPGTVVIHTRASLISAGTERMLVEFGRAGFLDKARSQPDKVRQVLDKVRTDGPSATLNAVRNKLDQPIPLGYCNAGVVLEVGAGVTDLKPGDRVVSNGPHAEVVRVPRNLVARIPDDAPLPWEHASFAVAGSIALQGIRLAAPTLGETVFVMGLGLLGQMTVQMLRTSGCHVIGSDFSEERLAMARSFGARTVALGAGEDPVAAALAATGGRGVDAVLITAATDSDAPMQQAAAMSRIRGRIVLVGVTGLNLSRQPFFEKELSFQVSCSYGPGRYDAAYEDEGHDYPFGHVRWTAGRNFQAVVDLLADGRLDVAPLVTRTIPIAEAPAAYDALADGQALGIVLSYPERDPEQVRRRSLPGAADGHAPSILPAPGRIGILGAGNYTTATLLPTLQRIGAKVTRIGGGTGATTWLAARRFGISEATTDNSRILDADDVDTVLLTTRHDSHARLAIRALERHKNVFVEKPLALTLEEVDAVEDAWRAATAAGRGPLLCVGFNRRFAPISQQMRAHISAASEPVVLLGTLNAGAIPASHWVQQPHIGGGRIIGEACHYIDLFRFLVGAPIVDIQAACVGGTATAIREDKAILTLTFADGSIGTIHYLANGHSSFPKERVEAFVAGQVLVNDNFRTLRHHGGPLKLPTLPGSQDKGHAALLEAFLHAVRQGGPAPIPVDELLEVSRWSIRAAQQLHA